MKEIYIVNFWGFHLITWGMELQKPFMTQKLRKENWLESKLRQNKIDVELEYIKFTIEQRSTRDRGKPMRNHTDFNY